MEHEHDEQDVSRERGEAGEAHVSAREHAEVKDLEVKDEQLDDVAGGSRIGSGGPAQRSGIA